MRSFPLLAASLVTLGWIAAGPVSAQGLPELTPGCQLTLEDDPERVQVETALGTLTLQLFPSVAAATVANFLGYIERARLLASSSAALLFA